MLLTEDAQAASAGASTDRSSRRLFDRLVAIRTAREPVGRLGFVSYSRVDKRHAAEIDSVLHNTQ
jgi:hypothetical protein